MSIDFAIKESLLGLNRDKYRTQGPLIMRLLDSDARTSSIIRGNSFPQQRTLCKIYSKISRDARLQTNRASQSPDVFHPNNDRTSALKLL